MFKIGMDKKSISKLPTRSFSELEIKEREHLQEWIAKEPTALGEDLLIIQKEFDGFKETNERLDLLALDKTGSLVIIENKLDDSGKDVVWQALKYVAYCSSLKKSEIIDIFEKYLNKPGNTSQGGNASQLICEFLGEESIEEVNLNSGSTQRFILVAANFKKEVTTTVLWLISNGIRGQCMKTTPFELDGKYLLNITKIIPIPDAEDYMISMSSKDREEKEYKAVATQSKKIRMKFWEYTLDYFRTENFELFRNISPSTDSWIQASASAGGEGCFYLMGFLQNGARVELIMQNKLQDKNKQLFEFIEKRKVEIEGNLGYALEWYNPEEQKSSRIFYEKNFDGYNEENWPEISTWLLEHLKKFEAVFGPVIKEYKK